MKNTNLLSLLILFLFAFNISAQNEEMLHKYHLLKGDAIRVQKVDDLNISGSPYYNNTFQPAYINFPKYAPLLTMVRYDMVKEEMQVLIDKENYQVLEDNVTVKIKDRIFQKFDFIGFNKELNIGYFEVLQEDIKNASALLLRKHSKELNTNSRSQARGFPAKYTEKTEYFLKVGNSSPAVIVHPRLSNFLIAFPYEHRGEIEDYIKKNKLNHKKEVDLFTIVEYYNSKF